jgi:hypothetical protein
MRNFLVLYKTEEEKWGSMVVNAVDEENLAKVIYHELTELLGKEKKFWYQYVDTAVSKAHIYDVVAK